MFQLVPVRLFNSLDFSMSCWACVTSDSITPFNLESFNAGRSTPALLNASRMLDEISSARFISSGERRCRTIVCHKVRIVQEIHCSMNTIIIK